MSITFRTQPAAKLPKTRAFGGQKLYDEATIAAAIKAIRAGQAISDDKKHDDAKKARNAAGTLRGRIRAADAAIKLRTYVNDNGDKTFTWWIAPQS